MSAAAPPTTPRAGVALPGIRAADGSVLQRAVNLSRLEGVPVRQLFERALQRPVHLETDVNAAGWAQWRTIEPRPRRFVYLSLGTGVGGCVVLDGQVVRHTHDGPGHLGHLVVDTSADAPRCACGARGCLEAIVAGPAVPHASAGSAAQAAGARGAAHALAAGLLLIAHLYAPDTIVLGGGLIDHQRDLVARARAAFSTLGHGLVPDELTVRAATLPSDQAGVIGAALLALQADS